MTEQLQTAQSTGVELRTPQFDPLQSATLQQELPGLLAACDEQVMLEQLRGALFDPARPGYTLHGCELDQATYLPGQGAILRYQLEIEASDGARLTGWATGRLFSDGAACAAYRRERLGSFDQRLPGRIEVAPFTQTVATLEPLHMVAHAFPIDGEMPTLVQATDARQMLEVLRTALDMQDAATCRVEMVDYGRQQRCTLRYMLADAAGVAGPVVYGKLTADNSGALAGPISTALREWVLRSNSGYRFNVPRIYGWHQDLQLSLLEAIPGKDLIPDVIKAHLRGKPAPPAPPLEELIDTCARIAAALHTAPLAIGPRRSLDDELAALRRQLAPVLLHAPALGAWLLPYLEQLGAAAAATPPLPAVFNHGDFTFGQILIHADANGLVDFDSCCQAEPALDLGQFLTYLQVAGLKGKQTPHDAAAFIAGVREQFMHCYLEAAGIAPQQVAALRARVALYEVSSGIRRVLRSWQKLKASRIEAALPILQTAAARLAA